MHTISHLDQLKENKTTQYLVYLTGYSIRQLKNNGFILAFSGINEDPDAWTKTLVLLYNKTVLDSFSKHKYQMEHIDVCVKDSHVSYSHTIEKDDYSMLIFNLDEYAQKIFDKIWAGKYSELPKSYKDEWFDENMVITGFHDLAKKHHVVNKTPFLKKSTEKEFNVKLEDRHELESKPLLRDEILDYQDLPSEEDLTLMARIKDEESFLARLQKETTDTKFAGLREHYANLVKA